MLNLLRADLYRITRPRGLRGLYWQYLALVAVVLLAAFAVTAYVEVSGLSTEGVSGVATHYDGITDSWSTGFLNGGLYTIIMTFAMAETVISHDFKGGYIKTLVSSTRGKLAYMGEKVLLAGVWSAMMLVTCIAASTIWCLACGSTFGAEPVLDVLVWIVLAWLIGWVVGLFPLAICWLTRSSAWPLMLSLFVLAVGALRGALQLVASILSYGNAIAASISRVLATFCDWLPTMGIQYLAGTATPTALAWLPGGGNTQVLIICLVWGTVFALTALAVARRKDL